MQTIENILMYLASQFDYIFKKVTSRKFLLALAGASVACLNQQWELVQGVIIAYLAAEGLDDFVPALKGVDFKRLFGRHAAAQGTSSSAAPVNSNPSLGGEADTITPAQSTATPAVMPVPFNKEAFIESVESGVSNAYGIRNACTLFYQAQNIFNAMSFNNEQAWNEAKSFMLHLAEKAFEEVWGENYDEALLNVKKPDKHGCTYPTLEFKAMQYGIAYYSILLEYKRIKVL